MSVNSKSEVAKRFVGAWRYVGSTVDGKPLPGRGANPKGLIHYDSSGYMSVQVAPDQERKKAGSTPTPEEAQAALVEYIAYLAPTRSTSRPPRSRTTARAACSRATRPRWFAATNSRAIG